MNIALPESLPLEPGDPETGSRGRARPGGPTTRRIARRRGRVTLAKRVLPVVALLLLTLIALWPEISRDVASRVAFQRGAAEPESGQLTQARYNGVDEHSRPYTVTADFARQSTTERIDLTRPIGDMSLQNGTWMRGEARNGVYMQSQGVLDLSGDVTLYRDDGISMQTDTATLDVKSGAATSAALVHVEGPFGTIDAQGFSLVDRGAAIQFAGPGRLLLNGQRK